VIITELANIRTYIRECDPDLRSRVVAKLVYLSMIGLQAACSHTECLNLMADSRFSFKCIGYLGTLLFIGKTTEMFVLLTRP
jgi:AP-1 complex subunit gamma-1